MTIAALVMAVAGSAIPLIIGAAPATAAPAGTNWALSFADEFSGSTLNTAAWHRCQWWATTTCTIESNHELELYRPDNVSVANGMLKLQARAESTVGWNGKTYNYTSGMVSTGGRAGETAPGFVFRYGYVEARVKVPGGQGMWPALWLLPASHTWPPEIDVMEILGNQPALTHMHYHYLRPDGTAADAGTTWLGPDFSAGWHTFAVDWEPNALIWYVDGIERARYSDPATITAEPSYVLLNLAVGGDWPGAPDTTTAFPSDYLVDYVRVWTKTAPTPATVATVDTTPPAVRIASPTQGSTATKGVSVVAGASDNVRVTRMQVLADGVTTATSSSGSISYQWNPRGVSVGVHVITVKAFDAAGNVGQSAVTVHK